MTLDGRKPWVEDNLGWKRKRRRSGKEWWKQLSSNVVTSWKEDNLGWKTTWKTTLIGRRPRMEDDLGWKDTLDVRRHWMKDDLIWKETSDGRQPWMEDDLKWKMTLD